MKYHKGMKANKIFLTLKQFSQLYKWPTYRGVVRIYTLRKEKGYDTAFLREGRRILVDVNEFFDCLERKNKKTD